MDITNRNPQPELARRLTVGAWIATAVVLLLVGLMRRVKLPLPEGWDFGFLPPFHATLNALTAPALVYALYEIKRGNVAPLPRAVYVAIGLS